MSILPFTSVLIHSKTDKNQPRAISDRISVKFKVLHKCTLAAPNFKLKNVSDFSHFAPKRLKNTYFY